MGKATVSMDGTGSYVVVKLPKSSPSTGGHNGGWRPRNVCCRSTRQKVFRRIVLKDWTVSGQPVMLTLTTRQILDAVLCAKLSTQIHRHLRAHGVAHAGRIEFQSRGSAHLHYILGGRRPPGLISSVRDMWLEGVGEAGDAASRKYAVHAQPVTGHPLYVLLYISGHTTKADYQSVSPVPLRRWFWLHLEPLPDLTPAGEADVMCLRLLQAHYGQAIRPVSFGASVVAEADKYYTAVDLARQWLDLGSGSGS